jgi:hypothetical protein
VQSFSNLTFEVRVEKPVSQPGDLLQLQATLRQYEVPLTTTAAVFAEITPPGGLASTVPLQAQGAGLFAATFPTTLPGLYGIRFRAMGSTIEGEPFQREQTRTAVVLRAGTEVPPDGAGRDQGARCLCELLRCLLTRPTVLKWLDRHELKGEELMECVRAFCTCVTTVQRRPRPAPAAVPGALTRAHARQLMAALAAAQLAETAAAPAAAPVQVLRAPFPTEVHRGMTFHVPEDQLEKPEKPEKK